MRLTLIFGAIAAISSVLGAQDSVTQGTWLERVQTGLERFEYRPSSSSRGLQAPNRAQAFRTFFDPSGIRLQEREQSSGPSLLQLSLVSLGRGAALEPIDDGTPSLDGVRVEIRRPEFPGLIEWYDNSSRGLEQGFVLEQRPSGAGRLVLELQIEGAQATLQGEAIALQADSGRRFRYGELFTVDAAHRELPSHLEVPAPDRVRLVIDDSRAQYPIVIDPLLTGAPDGFLESNESWTGSFDSAMFGSRAAGAGDVNGDGYGDVVVGAYGFDNGLFDEGAAFVFLGSASGLVGTDPATANAVLLGDQAGTEFGNSVSGAGDVNGDGYDDILISAHHYHSTIVNGTLSVDGGAFVFLGSATGITGTGPSTADTSIFGNLIDSRLGHVVSGAGDVNGDGFGDIIIGVPLQGIPFPPNIPINQGSGNGGAALIFLGSATGIDDGSFADADSIILPHPPGQPVASLGQIGAGVAGAGDVNNDGFDDVIIGSAGATLVFHGSAAGIVGTHPGNADAVISADASFSIDANVAGAGDVNGDGFDDILLADSGFGNSGVVLVFEGSAAGITATNATEAQAMILGNPPQSLGWRFSGAGDVDNDGFDDILAGSTSYLGGLNLEGAAYVFRGSASGITATGVADAYIRLEPGQSGAAYRGNKPGFSVAAAGDVNGDGFGDVLMGMGLYDAGQTDEGAVFVYHGGSAPPNPNQPPVPIAGPDQTVVDVDNSGEETITVDGSASFDPDGLIVGYEWLLGETVLGTSAVLTTSLPFTGNHTLVLVVTDDAGHRMGDAVTVRVELVPSSFLFVDYFDLGLVNWVTGGDVQLSQTGPFPDPPQALLGAAGATLSRSVNLPLGTTGIELRFWGKSSQFAPADEVWVKASIDGGPFTTFKTFTVADSDDQFYFSGGWGSDTNFSWYPQTASNVVIEFESNTTTGLFTVDDIVLRALIAPLANQGPIADPGPNQTLADTDGDGFETVTLDGSASIDQDGLNLTYAWSEDGILFGTAAIVSKTMSVGSHTVSLTVTDQDLATDTNSVQVTVSVAPPGPLVADGFESGNFSGGTGNWVGSWSNNQCDIQNGGAHSGSRHARLRKTSGFLRRTFDAFGINGAHLTFWGRADQFEGSDDLLVKLRIDGGPSTTLETITTAASDNVYRFYDVDLTAFPMTADVRIEFDSNMDKGFFYIDDIEINGFSAPPNVNPVADAGTDLSSSDSDNDGSEFVTLDGSASFDSDGSIVSYEWREGALVLGSTAVIGGPLSVGIHVLTLVVTDSNGATASDSMTVSIDPNQPPTANAGPSLAVVDTDESGFEMVTLEGAASFDTDGSIVAYEWREGALLLGSGPGLSREFGVGDHLISLTVTDNGAAIGSATLTISVLEPPPVYSGRAGKAPHAPPKPPSAGGKRP